MMQSIARFICDSRDV